MLNSAGHSPVGIDSWWAHHLISLSVVCAACLQGMGLVWPTSIGRLEVNLVKVLKHQACDKFNPYGLQVGFTASI